MHPFIAELEISIDAARVIAQGMMKLAACDGIDRTEVAMIEAFLADCYQQVGGEESYEALLLQEIDLDEARRVLDSNELRELFMRSCQLLACADRVLTEPERALLDRYAQALEIPAQRHHELAVEVRGHVLEEFAATTNSLDQVAELGRQLGADEKEIERVIAARAAARAGTSDSQTASG